MDEIDEILRHIGHEGIYPSADWEPDTEVVDKLHKLLKRAKKTDDHQEISSAQNIFDAYVIFGVLDKEYINGLYKHCKRKLKGTKPNLSRIKQETQTDFENSPTIDWKY